MKRSQVDFLRNIVTARKTKNSRPRDIPMNDEVRQALAELCKDKRSDDYVFVSPKDDDKRQREVKKGLYDRLPTRRYRRTNMEGSQSEVRHSISRGRMRCVYDCPTPRSL